jgi:hypothetical protein
MTIMDLTEQVEISRGQFKKLGDCTHDDLAAAAQLLRDRAAGAEKEADSLQQRVEQQRATGI